MRFWWVNQNQTWRHEIAGGYLWSPKRKSNGHVNPFYESMREVAPGDLVLSFRDTRIAAIGIAQSHCYECPKPPEFGAVGRNWDNIGWKVDVKFLSLDNPIRPKDHIDRLRHLLPSRYSPLLASGDGSQSIYLAEIPQPLFNALSSLIGAEATNATRIAEAFVRDVASSVGPAQDLVLWEEHLRDGVMNDAQVRSPRRKRLFSHGEGRGCFDSASARSKHGAASPAFLIRSTCEQATASHGGTAATTSVWTARTVSY